MFVGDEIWVNVSAAVAAPRLVSLLDSGLLSTASHEAWIDGTARVGPMPGLSKLVHVRVQKPVQRGSLTVFTLRWEAEGAGERLFPALDADIILIPDGEDGTLIGLEGSYLPPLGRAGAVLDRAILHRIATATIRSLLNRIASAITDEAPVAAQDA